MLSRARTPWCPLVAVLLVVFGALGALCGGSAAAATASVPGPDSAVTAQVSAEAPADASAGRPGCGKGSPEDADHVPGTPARSGTSYEVLPALYDAHAATGAWGADQLVPSAAPGRAPPAFDPPSPMDLSVLRV
ncbi:hypothetical protein ABZV77_40835 [Streptomyces sp. NPDC004732]|uniref:hypothetical protein n=1 Tax=Streptomyces sp. NPDC004732 TaxID=3154290 RepID=UPI00339EAF6F